MRGFLDFRSGEIDYDLVHSARLAASRPRSVKSSRGLARGVRSDSLPAGPIE